MQALTMEIMKVLILDVSKGNIQDNIIINFGLCSHHLGKGESNIHSHYSFALASACVRNVLKMLNPQQLSCSKFKLILCVRLSSDA